MDRLICETDIDKVERLLQNVTYAQLEKADLKRIRDKNLIKLFKLGQLSTEYLLFTQGYADTMATQRQREYEYHFREASALQEQIKENQRRINSLREKDAAHKQTLKTYEALMSNNEDAANSLRTKTKEGNKCQFCLKVFATLDFLHAHYKKRHP